MTTPASPPPPVEAAVFDLGGVLIDWNPRHLYRRLFRGDDDAMEDFLATVCTPEWNTRQDAGRPFAQGVEELIARHPDQAELIAAYHERWGEMLAGPIPGTVALLDELRLAGLPLYALTNWSAETFPIARERYGFLRWFDGVVVSGEEGLVKPQRALFEILADRYALRPGRTVFVDDVAANVEGARAAGFRAIHFRDPDQLRGDLVAAGLPLTAEQPRSGGLRHDRSA